MDNLRTLGILLDALDRRIESLSAPRPTAPIARLAPVAAVAQDPSEASHSARQQTPSPQLRDPGLTRGGASHIEGHDPSPPPLHAELIGARAGLATLVSASPSASLELSPAAQQLHSALSSAAAKPALPIRAVEPLAANAADPAALAHALQNSIRQSGVFYESHLAEWSAQRYPEAELRREPQAQWGTTPSEAESTPPAVTADDRATGAVVSTSRAQGDADLLRTQLQALECRQVCWQGDLWPGQSASLTIGEDEDITPEDDRAPTWRTRLSLNLPELGRVDADLRLSGTVLTLALQASEAATRRLAVACDELKSALEVHAHVAVSIGIRGP